MKGHMNPTDLVCNIDNSNHFNSCHRHVLGTSIDSGQCEQEHQRGKVFNRNNWVRFDHECLRPSFCPDCDRNQTVTYRNLMFTSGGRVIRSSDDCCLMEEDDDVKSPANSSFKIVINMPMIDCLSLLQNNRVQVQIICNNDKFSSGIDDAAKKRSKDLQLVLERNLEQLKLSGWYWGDGVDSQTASRLLSTCSPGTFLIRDSSDPRYMFTLSVQTERGPTSVRLTCKNGKFSFDSDDKLSELLPKFDSVVSLVEYYVSGGNKIGKQVWVDSCGLTHSPVTLTKPLRRQVCSLKHLCRVTINKAPKVLDDTTNNVITPDLTPGILPSALKSYLNDYKNTL